MKKISTALFGFGLMTVVIACDKSETTISPKASATQPMDSSSGSEIGKVGSGDKESGQDSGDATQGSGGKDKGSNGSGSAPNNNVPVQDDGSIEIPVGGEMPDSKTPVSDDGDSDVEVPVADASCYKGDEFICNIEKIIDEETNKLRISSGKKAMIHVKEISFVARSWSVEMATRGSISHDGFPAKRKAVYTAEFKKSIDFWAENAAALPDSSGDATKIAKGLVDMWWKSEGHKANMLSDHKNIGSGVSKKGNTYYATQLFN